MPKKFTITVPEPIYDTLAILARIKDKSTASLASQMVEEAAVKEKETGIIEKFQELTGEPTGMDKAASKVQESKDRLIEAIAKGESPRPSDVSVAANSLRLSSQELNRQIAKITGKKNY